MFYVGLAWVVAGFFLAGFSVGYRMALRGVCKDLDRIRELRKMDLDGLPWLERILKGGRG